jgi:hypothetical protein
MVSKYTRIGSESTECPGDRNSKLFLHAEDRVLGRLGEFAQAGDGE